MRQQREVERDTERQCSVRAMQREPVRTAFLGERPPPSVSDHIARRTRLQKGARAYLLRALRQISETVRSAEVHIARQPRAGEKRAS